MTTHDQVNCINSKPCFDCEYPLHKTYLCPQCKAIMDDLGEVLICTEESCGWNEDTIDAESLDYYGRLDFCTPKCIDKEMPHTCKGKFESPY